LVVTTALFDDISGIPSIRNQLLRARKKSQNPVFQPRIGEDGLVFSDRPPAVQKPLASF
jgi:hypothetical protein